MESTAPGKKTFSQVCQTCYSKNEDEAWSAPKSIDPNDQNCGTAESLLNFETGCARVDSFRSMDALKVLQVSFPLLMGRPAGFVTTNDLYTDGNGTKETEAGIIQKCRQSRHHIWINWYREWIHHLFWVPLGIRKPF